MKKKGKKILNKKGGAPPVINSPPQPNKPEAHPMEKVIPKETLKDLKKIQQVKIYKAGRDALDERTLIYFIQAITILSIINFIVSRDFLKYQKSEAVTYIGFCLSLGAAFGLILVSIIKEFADKEFASEFIRAWTIIKAIVSRNAIVWYIVPQLMFATGLVLDNSKFYFLGNYPDRFRNWNNLCVLGLFIQVYLFLQSMINSISGRPISQWMIPMVLFFGVLTIISEVMIYVLLYLQRVDG